MSDGRVRAGMEAGEELARTKAAFEAVRAGVVRDWLASGDPTERERLHAKASVIEAVKAELLAAVAAGRVAKSGNG